MRVGQLCEMFAEFAYPREGQAMLTPVDKKRTNRVLGGLFLALRMGGAIRVGPRCPLLDLSSSPYTRPQKTYISLNNFGCSLKSYS